jgi:hypothetical protein
MATKSSIYSKTYRTKVGNFNKGLRIRRALKGARRVSKLLKQLPDEVTAEMRTVLLEKAPVITAYAKAAAPSRTGAMARAINFRLSPKTLRLRIGYLTKQSAQDFFYARILEFGRKAQTVKVNRFTGPGKRAVYQLRVKAIDRGKYDFLAGRAMRFAISQVQPRLATVWEKALRRAGAGGDE